MGRSRADEEGRQLPSRRAVLGALLVGAGLAPSPARAQGAVNVAAAADLKFALEALAPEFERASGHRVRLVFGSSGTLAGQILQGAPFHLFMSADEALVGRLVAAALALDGGRLYAIGRVGILVPKGSPLKADGTLGDLRAALHDGRCRRFAIAQPEHAPYGARAREALQHAGLWEAIAPLLVFGENVAQAAQFATSGAAQGGIVALSLARAPAVAALGDFDLIADSWHTPLRQRMVLIRDAPPAARAFHDHLGTPAARAVLARFGFAAPGG
jgi:molybdate transport system substrate-binding protein